MTLEAAIIEHCSPTLAGLKPASLFRYCPEEPEGFIPQFGLWRDALHRRRRRSIQRGGPHLQRRSR